MPLAGPGKLHRIVDPDSGDALMVVTALPPARGFVRRQEFVEFSLGESIHGVVIEPKSDDIAVEIAPDKVTVTRPGGLTLSAANAGARARGDRGTADLRCRGMAEGQQGGFLQAARRTGRRGVDGG